MNSGWSEQQKAQEEKRERRRARREKLAGYFFDISKLIFAALVLGGLSPILTNGFDEKNIPMIIVGAAATYLSAYSANRILK